MKFTKKIGGLRELIFKIWLWDAKQKILKIETYLRPDDKIIDVGCGSCSVSFLLRNKGYEVEPIDVRDWSLTDDIVPRIYDGKNIPFEDDAFDVALILTVLHHTPHPVELLKEAKRVAGRIVVIEDIYTNIFQQYLTYFMDSLVNFEFFDHPHTNKDDEGWKEVFGRLGLKLTDSRYARFLLLHKQAAYYLEK